jgi:dolichyl-phosphate beta-glucosyltransferase
VTRVLAHLDRRHPRAELLLVDDGSRDRTWEVMLELARADSRVLPLSLARNRGKGAAVRAGMLKARGEMCVFFDADLPYPLSCVEGSLARIRAGADLVIGARDLAAGALRYPWSRKAATAVFGALTERIFSLGIRDTQCGFKAFRREVAHALFGAQTIDGFCFDVELLVLARHWGLRLERLPVEMNPTAGSSIRLFRDSARMARDLWAIRRRLRDGWYPPRPRDLPERW